MEGECVLYQAEGESQAQGLGLPLAERAPEPFRDEGLSSLPDEALVGLWLGEAPALDTAGSSSREAAFAALVDRHSKAIRRVVRAMLGDTPDVDDVVQSAFTSAFRSLGTLRDRTRFKYWVRIIAVNEANDLAREQPESVPLDSLLTLPERSLGAAPLQAVEAAWLIEELSGRLPEEYMKVLYLRYYLDYTVNEVAEMLGVEPGLVKWRAHRAKRLARKALQEGEDSSKERAAGAQAAGVRPAREHEGGKTRNE